MLLMLAADFFQNQLFQKMLSGALLECQTIWIYSVVPSVLICVQAVCKGYQQMIKVTANNERVNYVLLSADVSACIISMKVFRIIPEFRILRLTFHRKSASKF